ncbi:integrase [Methylomonas sp. LL1]|uniref:primase-helicase family protein n=1 Tax=Methylomonas sp. LL1 TaxID=2785785 RepID=UPI0018C39BEF|nr:primase-helicase family protein [Methylomonas sp. LL1]QPK65159.1 integrase [Methylomonas sp. LL1]
MDGSHDKPTEDLFAMLAAEGELPPKRKPVIDLDRDSVDPRGNQAQAQAKTTAAPATKPAGMHQVSAQSNQPPVANWANGDPITPDDVLELANMNELYCHAMLGGKNVIVGRRYCQVQGQVFTFESPAEFKKKFLHEKKISGKNRGQAWLEWPGKNIKLGGTGFFPDPQKCPPDALNFFRGLQVKPMAGDVSPYLDHLKHVMCSGHEPSYRYLIGWMAHLFQKPDIKPSVAVVLKSVEGTGKGTMAEPLLRILGAHGNKTNGAYAIAGRFNSTVANRLLIFADEVDLTDKHVADRLKGIISETTVNMERKGLEIEPLPNYCRLIFASNHAKVLNAGIRERRYLVLEPSDRYAQDAAYFKRLWAWIENDGPAKLLNYLLIVNIDDFNPYSCPQTAALIAEKLGNLCGVNQFFYNQITQAEPFGGRARIHATELIDDFIAWSVEEGEKVTKAAAANLTGRTMAKLGIEVHGRSDRGNGKFYELPDKAVLVQQFAKMLDVPEEALES